MSIFGTIMSKIFGGHHADAAPAPTATAGATPTTSSATTPTGADAAPATAPVDVEAILDGMDEKVDQDLNWRTSIVDLMKLLGLDSSLSARKELAGELHYTGDMDDSASMNVWLHKEVMKKFAENGGKVPADLH